MRVLSNERPARANATTLEKLSQGTPGEFNVTMGASPSTAAGSAHVVVIGGNFAGVGVAQQLEKKGLRVTVIEVSGEGAYTRAWARLRHTRLRATMHRHQ